MVHRIGTICAIIQWNWAERQKSRHNKSIMCRNTSIRSTETIIIRDARINIFRLPALRISCNKSETCTKIKIAFSCQVLRETTSRTASFEETRDLTRPTLRRPVLWKIVETISCQHWAPSRHEWNCRDVYCTVQVFYCPESCTSEYEGVKRRRRWNRKLSLFKRDLNLSRWAWSNWQ